MRIVYLTEPVPALALCFFNLVFADQVANWRCHPCLRGRRYSPWS